MSAPAIETVAPGGAAATPVAGRGSRRFLRPGAVAAALVIGYFVPALAGGTELIYTTAVLIAIFAIMSYGNDLILSDLGEVSLGHTVFWAAGAYVTAILVINSGWGPLPSLVAALAFSTVLAFLLGVLTIRTREFVFSLVTYAAAIIATAIVSNLDVTGGSDGLVGIPLLTIPAVGGEYQVFDNAAMWPIAYVLLVLVIVFVARFRRSRLGVTSLMTQMNPDLATTMGVDVRRTRVLLFTLSAPVSALAGWLYAYQRSYVSPDLLSPFFLLLMLTAVVLPGKRLLLGPLLGTTVLVVQQQHFSFGGDVDQIILGGLLAGVLLTSPDGLAGWGRLLIRRFRRPPDQPDQPDHPTDDAGTGAGPSPDVPATGTPTKERT
jgi:branched-chain amino acid transport system permease protein